MSCSWPFRFENYRKNALYLTPPSACNEVVTRARPDLGCRDSYSLPAANRVIDWHANFRTQYCLNCLRHSVGYIALFGNMDSGTWFYSGHTGPCSVYQAGSVWSVFWSSRSRSRPRSTPGVAIVSKLVALIRTKKYCSHSRACPERSMTDSRRVRFVSAHSAKTNWLAGSGWPSIGFGNSMSQ